MTSLTYNDKWGKTKWLLGSKPLKSRVPDTKPFTRSALQTMLKRYPSSVYFKPTRGSGGNGIARIERLSSGKYRLHHGHKKQVLPSLAGLHAELKRFAGRRPYLLQRGIHLLKSRGRPFDLRVMVQKTRSGRWLSTGIFAKLGRPGKVVNNYNQGGRIELLPEVLKGAGIPKGRRVRMKWQLKRMGTKAGRCFDRHRKGFRELGLDVAIDRSRRMWILEVNTRPQYYPLKALKNKSMYYRIRRYARQYGRKDGR
ncbi:YheC/YheD family protein [Paenibacillus sp. S-38]|uniref:YheC/YheD family protein n=1 Tax=Paenibacillus sp. S-38 TaxID=3416710 RepID=UPI003CEB2BE9